VSELDELGHDDLYVMKYIEPEVDNAGALGLDIGSEPIRRDAVERAVSSGEPTLSAAITLVQNARHTPGFLLVVPVFRRGTDPFSPAQRRQALAGLLFAPMVVGEVLAAVPEVAAGLVNFQLIDTAGGNTLFDTAEQATPGPAGAADVPPAGLHHGELRLQLPGREAVLSVRSTPQFDAAHENASPWVVFVAGTLASALLAAAVALLLRQQALLRTRAEALAESLSGDLQRLAQVARHTSNAVLTTDRGQRIDWVNEGFTRLTGRSSEQARGLTLDDLLGMRGGQTPAHCELAAALAAEQGCRVELPLQAQDGRELWLDLEAQPLRDAGGALTGCMLICTDITASKNTTRDLARERLRLNNILEGTNVGTWEWNVETGVMVFNDRWAQIVGYGLPELMPTTVQTWSRLTHPDDLSRASVQLERHFNGEIDVYEYEVRLKHKAGHWVWGLGRGKLFSRSDDGRPRWMAGTLMDITERKLAEAALMASQALLDKTGRIAGVGGWSLDLDPQRLHWSDQTCRIHDLAPGHQPGLEEAIGYYAPEARETVGQAVQRCIDSGEGFDLELPLSTALGRPIWVRAVGELEHADGKPVRLVGIFQDITARQRLEAEVRRYTELITSVIENLPCGLSVFNADLQLVVSNTEFRRLLDLPDTLLAGPVTRFEDFIRFNAEQGEYGPCDIEATVQARVARAREWTEPHQFERVRPNGIPLEIRGGPMPGGGFISTYSDISARHRAEAELQRASALLRGSIDSLDDAYALFDPDDRLVLCNQPYRDLYPLCADLMQPGASFEDIVRAGAERGQYAEAAGRLEAWVAERMAIHRQPASLLTQRLGDGRILRIGERRMADGHTVGYRVDITEFVHATEAAQEASRSKSQFLANMSHEIRTPMNAILGMLALLKKTELTARQADYTGKTEGAARSLLGLLNDILDFSKVEAGKMALDLHPFRPDQLLHDLAVILAANTAGKPIEVLFDVDPALPAVLIGDAMRLQQVLINLGGNAIKFTAQGEVVVSLAVVHRSAEAVTIEIAVRDSGIGIAPENQQRIFSGFSQAEASTTRRFGGTGLGLAICRRLVGLMGSDLQLDSEIGRGSRFHFRVDLAVGDAAATADLAAPPLRQPVSLRVLVVDDNASARALMDRMAQSLGWQVTLADGGAAALACLQREDAAFDAIFIDWQMPGLDGWDTCAQIRQGGSSGVRPLIIMVTAHGREMLSHRSEEEQARVDGFLVKPVTASMLYDAVVDARADPNAPVPSRAGTSASAQRLAGMRLLVVEDNANNQQVARELLEDEGAEVQIADNGQLGVEAVAATDPPFDVVLMDLQMPVMDGYTAATRIRQDLQLLTLPIVAMTANAMASDREACLAAGMNEHVGKPFDLEHLVAVLRRLAGRAEVATSGLPGSGQAMALPPQVLAAATAAGVDLEKALDRLGGKLKAYGGTLQRFTADLRGLPQQLDTQLRRGDRDAVRRDLHTLKGVAATVGVTALSKLAGEAEAQLSSLSTTSDEAGCVARVNAAIELAVTTLDVLRAALGDGQQAAATDLASRAAAALGTADTALLAGLLRSLQGLLQASDLDAAAALQALRTRLPGVAGPRLDALETAVEALEFETALSHCGQWLEECET
jgi:PAS domain S-box-containing protein